MKGLIEMEELVRLFERQNPDWWMVLVTAIYAVITIGIMVANHNSAKIAKRQLKEQEKQLEEQKKEAEKAEKRHQDVLSLQRNEARVTRMPYFYLSPNVVFSVRNNRVTLRVNLENCGNGSAVQIKLMSKTTPDQLHTVVHQNEGTKITYIQTDILCCDFSRVGSSIGFEIMRDSEDANKDFSDKVEFEIQFQDMLGNNYRQSFRFDYTWNGTTKKAGKLGLYFCNQPQLR